MPFPYLDEIVGAEPVSNITTDGAGSSVLLVPNSIHKLYSGDIINLGSRVSCDRYVHTQADRRYVYTQEDKRFIYTKKEIC